jgi:hypothetical protein
MAGEGKERPTHSGDEARARRKSSRSGLAAAIYWAFKLAIAAAPVAESSALSRKVAKMLPLLFCVGVPGFDWLKATTPPPASGTAVGFTAMA